MALAETIAPFLWGAGGSKKTPEQVAREREIAAALMQGGMDYSPVDHWLQGAARAAQGGVGALKDRWANEAETAGREGFQSQWDSVFGGGQGAPVQTASIDPVAAALVGTPQTASDATAAMASAPSGDNAGYIRQGLVSRGLPEHVADAFVMNFQDESGLNPGINEASPIVPGSRGGYGLYQLTGPRRVAYEQYAQQMGVDPSNVDAQLDFMMSELQGPEANAYQSIMSAPDTGSAAAAIVTDFLRPAEEHRNRRVAQYTGGGAAPVRVAQAGGQPSIEQLIGLSSDPWANDSQKQILQALMGQQLQQQDPAYQLDLALKQAQLDAANAPAGPEYGFTFAPDGTLIRTDTTSGTFDPMGSYPKPESGPLVSIVNGDGAPGLGKLSTDYGYVLDPETGQPVIDPATGLPTAAAVPGSPAALEAAAAATKAETGAGRREVATDVVTTAASIARNLAAKPGNTGLTGAVWANLSETEAAEMRRQVDVLKATATIENLTAMRQASPTGGALGSVTEKEGAMLAAASGAIDPNSSGPDFQRALDNYERTLLQIVHGPTEGDRIFNETRQSGGNANFDYNAPEAPEGWGGDPALWRFMSPEDRALW